MSVIGCPRLLEINSGETGAIFCAIRGRGTISLPLFAARIGKEGRLEGDMFDQDRGFRLPTTVETFPLTMTESRDPGHTDHRFSERLSERIGIANVIPCDSQAKYGLVARRSAHFYLRHSVKKGYREKIWDHAPGSLILEEAGGMITDFTGCKLDFSRAQPTISVNGGILASNIVPSVDNGMSHAKFLETLQNFQQ
jgi:3'(2'), 5'-bisphosphate nucleotidase